MSRRRYSLRSVSDAKSDLRTDARRTKHSSARFEHGGAVDLYTSNSRAIVAGSSMSDRHEDGTWIVPMSSVDSSRDVPTKSYDRHAKVNAVALSFKRVLCAPSAFSDCRPCRDCNATWNSDSSALCRKLTATLRCEMSDVPGVCWFISDTS